MTARLTTLMLAVLFVSTTFAQDTQNSIRETAIVKTVRNVQSSVAAIFVRKGNGRGSGSGSVIDHRGYVLTAKHVVGDENVILLGGRPPMRAEVVGSMPEFDLAILKLGRQAFSRPASPQYPLDGTPMTIAPLGVADDVMLGESILNIGNPGGRGIVVTRGIISALNIYGGNALAMATQSSNGFNQMLQFDAASNPGNSGGPLFNSVGQQVGVVTSSIRGEEGIHFAVPLVTIRKSIREMLYPEIRQGYVSGITVNPQTKSVQVVAVDKDTPADTAGLKPGDVIVAVDGRRLRDPIDWEFTRLQWKPEQDVALEISRDGESQQVKITLGKRHAQPPVSGVETEPGLICRAATYDPRIGAPLSDENWPTTSPMVVETVTARPPALAVQDHYELVYTGFLEIKESGLYRIAIKSDDGSRLFVHDRLVVDNDGNHADQIRTGWVHLASGKHPIRIEFYEDEGNENLELLIAKGDGELEPVPASQLFHEKTK